MFRTFRAWLGLAGLLAYAAFAVPRIVPALEGSQKRLREAGRHLGESEDEVLARFRTPEYVAALRRVRDTIPRDAAYFLLPADDGHGDYFVRFDLAPRRPVLLEKPGDEPSDGDPAWVVLSRLDPPGPQVLTTAEFYRRGARK